MHENTFHNNRKQTLTHSLGKAAYPNACRIVYFRASMQQAFQSTSHFHNANDGEIEWNTGAQN